MGKKATNKGTGKKTVVAVEARGDERPRAEEFDWRTFDPAMLDGGLNARLATEMVTYRDRLDELLRHEGEYVLIKGRSIVGYFRDRKSAVAAAIAQFGPGPVLIKKVVEREPLHRVGNALV